jgi:uncharacterized protein (DUF1684 family)
LKIDINNLQSVIFNLQPKSAGMSKNNDPTWLDLYDWRRRVADMYREREAALREGQDESEVLWRFRSEKDALLALHPQSPLNTEQRKFFRGLSYFPYDSALRLEATLEPEIRDKPGDIGTSGPHAMPMKRAAQLRFTIDNRSLELIVYWIDVYGGGLFLPFLDATCPEESYGGGRYLFDTVKGSDFLRLDDAEGRAQGYAGGRVIMDFNYAYNPSCAYDARWVCPLAPKENHLPVPIRAGERKFHE